ncbi:LysM peptidoglycan-binding domain-containing protein [Flavobacterium sp. ASW18X]|nr:LysM peptidoglycan-binding domain-containing protein [Flavobacterium sp. ASW18X]
MGIMKNSFITAFCVVCTFVLGTFCVSAQQRYITHGVEKGETLYSIAKKYRVTPFAILKENPEITDRENIKPNTILVIPVSEDIDGATEEKPIKPKPEVQENLNQDRPIGYTRHKVRKRETLFGITKAYNITEEQLKRYNKELYATPLRKGMVLQIPKYPEVPEEEETDIEFFQYQVLPKETRWSIANKYGITVDSLIALNPNLPKNSSYLAEGQELRLPRPKGDSLKEQQVGIFESYTVPKSIGIYRISQNYGIPVDSVIALNPEIKDLGGLKEGMVLRLPKRKPNDEIVNTENFIFYQVKPKQTVFTLTRNLKISRDSLLLLNPELENGLKAGMVLKLPKKKEEVLQVKNALVIDQINLLDSINVVNKPNLMFLLPFRLDRVDFSNSDKTQNQITGRKDISYAMGLYSGAMIALDSLKHLGISVNVKAFDTERNADKVNAILAQHLLGIDAIVGPVDPSLLNTVAAQATQKNIPVVAPFASANAVNFNNVFYSMPNDELLRNTLLDYIEKNRTKEQVIVIADAKHLEARQAILKRLPYARVANMAKDGSLHLVDFKGMLTRNEENWVIVETTDESLVASVSSILNASNHNNETGGKTKVRMFTTNYNSAFEGEDVSRPHLSNLKFTFPAPFKVDETSSFVKAYKKKYGIDPDRYAVRGYDMTMDLVLKLAYKKNLFETNKEIGVTEYSGNKFDYYHKYTAGYYNNAVYVLGYDNLYIKELK